MQFASEKPRIVYCFDKVHFIVLSDIAGKQLLELISIYALKLLYSIDVCVHSYVYSVHSSNFTDNV